MKKEVSATFAFLKFYVKNGWTKEELDECCLEGEVFNPLPDSLEPYFILDLKQNSKFDTDKLLPKISNIKTNCPEFANKPSKDILQQFSV